MIQRLMDSNTPLVSVLMLTYNHEPYIAQAIESVLMQKTDFPFELIIGEDCSTDGTRFIVEEYAHKHPGIVRLLSGPVNGGALANIERVHAAARGKYIATLEGDDYWNDELKLQRQVAFLEQNPDYTMVHSDVNHLHQETGRLEERYNYSHHLTIPEGDVFEKLLDPETYIVKTPTALFRRDIHDMRTDYRVIREKGWVIADLFNWLSMARYGKFKYFPEVMATYRVLRNSSSNSKDLYKKLALHKSVYEIRLYFIEKCGCPESLAAKVRRFYVTAIMVDAISLHDEDLLRWIKNYSRENLVVLGIRNNALLLKTKLGEYLKKKSLVRHSQEKSAVMKSKQISVLFVASGNHGGLHHGTKAQMDSLAGENVQVDYFLVDGKGMGGYLTNLLPLKRKAKERGADIVHAIGGHCGLLGAIALFKKRKVVSYLGSDIQSAPDQKSGLADKWLRKAMLLSGRNYVQIIVKSKRMLGSLPTKVLSRVHVIPNGVDFARFMPMAREEARKRLDLKNDKKYILFLGDKKLRNKNFKLVEDACRLVNDDNLEILNPFPVAHSLVPFYMNAADLLILTSFSEGSPNIIKEALACNCPIVATDVGDVSENLAGIEECFVSSYSADDVAAKITAILRANKRTSARERIRHLDNTLIAKKIVAVYEKALKAE